VTAERTAWFSGAVVTIGRRGPSSGDTREDGAMLTAGRRGPGGGDGRADGVVPGRGGDGGRCGGDVDFVASKRVHEILVA
jgi:hypothetical protein